MPTKPPRAFTRRFHVYPLYAAARRRLIFAHDEKEATEIALKSRPAWKGMGPLQTKVA